MYGNGSPYGGSYPPSPYGAQTPYGSQYNQGPYGQGSYCQNQMVVQQPGMHHGRGGRGMSTVPPFMPAPGAMPGVPFGLEYLASVEGIVVNQLVEWLEVFTGIETRNRYSLCNTAGQQPVIMVHRPYNCCTGANCCGCNGCCGDECVVECPPGQVVGRIVQITSCCHIQFLVKNMAGEPMFRINGPLCTCCCSDHNYPIYGTDDMAPVGAITKKWGGMAKEMYTDADTFFVNFPLELDVHLKALLLSATFLIDFMEYEDNAQNGNRM